ncbi:MAG: ABC transporter ATP-binding protein [Longimicrobiales bacterium]
MASVRLEHVRKTYGGDAGHVAVHDLSFQVDDGEFVVIVGPSGCGKSTTLRMVAGLEAISEGRIFIGERVVNEVPPKERDIAMVFQNYALYPHMSAYDNMAFGLKLRKLDRDVIDRRVRAAAGTLGIESLLERRPRELSGGQRQRIAVGRAIVRQPRVFLFDEPLSNLDAKLRVQMRAELSRLHRALDATMIYVTHDQVEAMTMGDRIVVLNEGELQQLDAPLTLYRRPANRFVAGFIGNPAMNFLDGTIERGVGDRPSFRDLDGALTLLLDRFADDLEPGQAVTLGVRPESLAPEDAGDAGDGVDGCIRATIELVEPLGNESFVYARAGGHRLVARLPPHDRQVAGESITLRIRRDTVHLFDRQSGGALLQGLDGDH